MKINIEMNLKFKAVANLDDLDVEELEEMGKSEKLLKDYFKQTITEDLDLLLKEDSDELQSDYKITRVKISLEEDE